MLQQIITVGIADEWIMINSKNPGFTKLLLKNSCLLKRRICFQKIAYI